MTHAPCAKENVGKAWWMVGNPPTAAAISGGPLFGAPIATPIGSGGTDGGKAFPSLSALVEVTDILARR